MKETLDFKLDKIEFHLKETVVHAIMIGTFMVVITLISLFSFNVFFNLLIGVLFIVVIISMIKREGKLKKEIFNKHYEVKIVNKK